MLPFLCLELDMMRLIGLVGWGLWVGVFTTLFAGCYSPERSLSLDPHNKPLIHILDSEYDAATGTVLVRWEYIGSEPVTFFEIQRRIGSSFSAVARIDGNVEAPNYIFVSSYQDEALIAGESVFYQVIAELAGGGREITRTESVTIPGAQALGVLRDPINLSAIFRWQPDASVATGYEIYRRVGNGSNTKIYETNDPTASDYTDTDISSNQPHHYSVRTLTATGKTLESRSVSSHFYRLATTQPVETVRPESESIRLDVGDVTTSGGTLALVARANQLSLYQFRYQIGLAFDGSPRILRNLIGIVFPDVVHFLPQSIDFAGPVSSSAFTVFPRIFVGGVLENGQIDIVGFEMPLFNRVWSIPVVWNAPVGATEISLARDNGRIYAVSGSELQLFSEVGGVIGNAQLDQTAKDISVQNNQIGVIWENGQISIGVPAFEQGFLTGIQWQTVNLPTTSKIVAVSHNSVGQLLLLDAGRSQIIVLQPNGNPLLTFELPGRDYDAGDLVVDQTVSDLVQVTDGRGDVTTFIP